jgi:CO/xanthine dehydrogenase Mo-binding subunit
MGEPAFAPVAASIANAVADAIGVRIFELPITPERVIKALAAKNAAAKRH